MGADPKRGTLADRADTKAKDIAAPCLKLRCRIMSRLEQAPAKRQYRRRAAFGHLEREATIRMDQLGANYYLCRMIRSIVLVAGMCLLW